MIDYHGLGEMPAKHHIQFRRPASDPASDGCPVYYEHCITRKGFDGGYSIAYRRNNPAMEVASRPARLQDTYKPMPQPLRRRHLVTPGIAGPGTLWESLRIVAGNEDVRIGTSQPTVADTGLVQDADGDLLLFLHDGQGVLDSELGRLELRRHDYVWIPRGLVHRIRFTPLAAGVQGGAGRPLAHVMWMECRSGLEVPSNFRNPVGQFRMDAPYSHRDFRRPAALSQADAKDADKGTYLVLTKRGDRFTERVLPHHPFDVVGWDGTAYPVAFSIHDYQPKTGMVHLPPPIHTTFLGGKGSFVICSFVPRKLDTHPEAIPCPYPHSSVDCDELLWYVEGQFASRKGVGAASITLHPAGIPHAPQPGRYEASFGAQQTDEMAVMVDTFKPLFVTEWGAKGEDAAYHGSWMGEKSTSGNYVD
ncbi:MAG TPA: homogentisate 1,2-dioxygenase [Candidatus Thermoplasmatota archaeon]|nr:homogentisate 1,2-dioxygenase [Candidatus Thermoplasmatota archaeon]